MICAKWLKIRCYILFISFLYPFEPFIGISKACTSFIANGVTVDGRPILGKVRHPGNQTERQRIWIQTPTTRRKYRIISINEAMGLNQTGFATANASSDYVVLPDGQVIYIGKSLYGETSYSGGLPSNYDQLLAMTWYYDPNQTVDGPRLMVNALAGCATVDEARGLIGLIFYNGTSTSTDNIPFMDAQGHATMFETHWNYWWREYDPLDPNRIAQNTYGFVVRGAARHYRDDGTDNILVSQDRSETGIYNLSGMIAENNLSINTLARGTSDPNTGYEFLRYGPNRDLEPITYYTNRSAMIVHGVAPGEDPALATMWAVLGPVDYCIAVPTWVWMYSVPDPLGTGTNGHMFDRALSLFNKGNELVTQQSIFPMEQHLFKEVLEVLLPHWRYYGTPSRPIMQRVADRMAGDGYSLLYCLDLVRYDNKAPAVDFNIQPEGMTLHFTLDASDTDGQIASVLWNFGDNGTSTLLSPSRTYALAGDYLISCMVTDNEGVSNTKWAYFRVPVSYDLVSDGSVNIQDFIQFAQHWLQDCSEPLWCGGADFNRSGLVDLMDMADFSRNWPEE